MKTMCPPGYHHNGFVATKKFLLKFWSYSSQTNNFMQIQILIYFRATWATFKPKRAKNKKNSPRKKFHIFPEIELPSSNIKKILIFSQKKASLIFSQKEAFPIFPKTEPCTFQSKLEK